MAVKCVQRGYSPHVAARFDPQRPKYTKAVKALGAFTPNEKMFQVLVAHLDAACNEAVDLLPADSPMRRTRTLTVKLERA